MLLSHPGSLYLFIFTGFLLILGIGCSKDEEPANQIPVVPVSFSINPNSTEYIRLNGVSGWEYLTGGYKGILIYRISLDEFAAFERACPYDWQVSLARIEIDSSGTTLYCPSCKSEFNLINGIPYKGPSRYSLKQYQTNYDGNLLYVFN